MSRSRSQRASHHHRPNPGRMRRNPSSKMAMLTPTSRWRPRDRADLHVHTTHSDGGCSPCEVVVAAARVGLAGLAITDHDTVSALPIARPEAARWGIELVSGVELTCQHAGREIHILGYFIEEDDPALLDSMALLQNGRAQRIEAMVERLCMLGLRIDLKAVRQVFPRAILGRRHLADYLTRTNQVPSNREVFARFLGDGCPACVDKPRLESAQTIRLIHQAGGVAALAHPPHDLKASLFHALASEGLDALEVDGPGFSREKSHRMRNWADQLGLVGIAGSDFHTADRPGRWVGAITTSVDDLERLRQASQHNRAKLVQANSPTGDPI
jgi:3',5'-nucleoside bisphosphate phosphatase